MLKKEEEDTLLEDCIDATIKGLKECFKKEEEDILLEDFIDATIKGLKECFKKRKRTPFWRIASMQQLKD